MNDGLTAPLIDYNALDSGVNKLSQKRLSFFIAESFQNIVRHGKSHRYQRDEEKKYGTFGIERSNGTITLHSSNIISEDDAHSLDQKLLGLSKLNVEQLKEQYVKALSSNELNTNGGAGLGLIEMVRKSNGCIKHKIEEFDDDYYFHFDVSLSENARPNGYHIWSMYFHELMEDQEISFLVKTNFNHTKFIQLNEIINEKMNDSDSSNVKQMNFFFIEMIQNIYKHGLCDGEAGNEGIFLLRETPEGTEFSTGNFIKKEDAVKLDIMLTKLNSASDKELNQMYQETLMENVNFENKVSVGLGLLEMKRMTPFEFEYDFITSDDDTLFFVNSIILEE